MEWHDEKALLRAVADDWAKSILGQAKPFLRFLTVSAVKFGFPNSSLQYLFFVLYERSRDWNLEPADKAALAIGRDITVAAAVTPAWSKSGIILPGGAGEQALDKAFKAAARWVRTDMAKTLLDSLNASLALHGREAEKKAPELDPGDGFHLLRGDFRAIVQKEPGDFHLGFIMDSIVHQLFT